MTEPERPSSEPHLEAPRRRWLALDAGASNWLWLSVLVIGLDQWTKYLIRQHFAEFEELTLLPILDFMRLHNEGAAFSFLSAASGWQRWLFVVLGVGASAGILAWLRHVPRRGRHALAAGLALVLGGALGNVIDRVMLGHVVDFIRVHYADWYFPAFNVADSAITVGAGLLILDNILEYRRERAQKRPS
jgi:signal peptidase II